MSALQQQIVVVNVAGRRSSRSTCIGLPQDASEGNHRQVDLVVQGRGRRCRSPAGARSGGVGGSRPGWGTRRKRGGRRRSSPWRPDAVVRELQSLGSLTSVKARTRWPSAYVPCDVDDRLAGTPPLAAGAPPSPWTSYSSSWILC